MVNENPRNGVAFRLRGFSFVIANANYHSVCQNEIYHKLNFLSTIRKVSSAESRIDKIFGVWYIFADATTPLTTAELLGEEVFADDRNNFVAGLGCALESFGQLHLWPVVRKS